MLWDELTNEEQTAILEALSGVCQRLPRVATFVVDSMVRLGIAPETAPRPDLSGTVDEFLRRSWPTSKRRGIA